MTENSIPEWEVINPDHTPFEIPEDDDEEDDFDDYEDDGEDDDDDYDYSLIVEL